MSAIATLNDIPDWTFHKKRDPEFQFLPDPHEYRLRSSRLWSPSGVFLDIRYVKPEYYTEEARYRGQYVHRATHLVDAEDPKIWKTLYEDAPQYLPFVEAYAEFKAVYRFKPRFREIPLYNLEYHYGTTPDGEGVILDGDESIVELKTGTMPWWTKIQTAAHDMALHFWDADRRRTRRRFGVELRKNGKFKAVEFTDEGDYLTWKCNLHSAKAHHAQPPAKTTYALRY